MNVTDRQQTDNRQTTDGRLIAYSDREREFTFAKNYVSIFYRFRVVKRYFSKVANFSYPQTTSPHRCDWTTPMITANDRQPMSMTSYSCSVVIIAVHRLVFEILTMHVFWSKACFGNIWWSCSGWFDFQHDALPISVLSFDVSLDTDEVIYKTFFRANLLA